MFQPTRASAARARFLATHARAGFPVRAITSRTRANAEAVAKRWDIPAVYDTVEELVADPSLIPNAARELIRRFPLVIQSREVRRDGRDLVEPEARPELDAVGGGRDGWLGLGHVTMLGGGTALGNRGAALGANRGAGRGVGRGTRSTGRVIRMPGALCAARTMFPPFTTRRVPGPNPVRAQVYLKR